MSMEQALVELRNLFPDVQIIVSVRDCGEETQTIRSTSREYGIQIGMNGKEFDADTLPEAMDAVRKWARKDETSSEPNMDRMGAKHIKECKGVGCGALLLWAKHVKKDGSIGNVAPLVKAKEGEKPNIAAWYLEQDDQWYYGIGEGSGKPLEYVSHFSNCPAKGQFK